VTRTANGLAKRFEQLYGGAPQLYRAPGRVNLIGEHTDYNDGFVMPAAINLYCYVAASTRSDRELHLQSENFSGSVTVDLDAPPLTKRGDWSDYVVGTAMTLEKIGFRLRGANLLIAGEVPLGSGLSSSAAVEVATGYALLDLAGLTIDTRELAIACRRAENEFVGARVGIMDQFISANGEADHALMLDCRSLDFKSLPIRDHVRLVVCNTGVKHSIAGGEYNQRRAQCEEGVKRLSSALPGITALRDVSPEDLEKYKALLPDVIYRRCRHVVTEDDRVERAAEALKRGDLTTFGKLMAESHRSLRDDYEVSCEELDVMVDIACKQPGVIGARMTGGGFGGCTVNLVQSEKAEDFRNKVAVEYEKRTGIHPDIYILSAAEGAHRLLQSDEIGLG
jgi:galactokinase